MKPKIIFFGTAEFGAIVLEGLVKNNYKPVLVITAPDKPVGRKQALTPPPVKISAQKYNISVLQTGILTNYKLQITNYKPDLIVCAAYGQIILKEILKIPRYGCLNVHPSLLPKYRGPSPIQAAILNGDKETGVTIMLMDEKIDHGDIVANSKFKIQNSKLTYEELNKKLAEIGANLLIETIPRWIKGEIEAKDQDDSNATYTKIIKKEDGKIDWSKPAIEIERQIRAFSPWPRTFTKIQNVKIKNQNGGSRYKILKILEADIFKMDTNKKIGEVFLTDDKKLAVQTGQNCLILRKLQTEGKKPMPAEEFLRGRREIIGAVLD